MALVGNYNDLKNVYAKIVRIWGSKSEGWNAWLGIFKSKHDQEPSYTVFVNAPYSDEEVPYKLLYNSARTQVPGLRHEDEVEQQEVVAEQEIPVTKPKKVSKGKKNSA